MGIHTTTHYTCDKCGKKIKAHRGINIVTSLSENRFWERLHVHIKRRWGIHNGGNTEDALLCKECTVLLLEDALARVKKGERATAGAEDVEQEGW